jgi:hypothetical protein
MTITARAARPSAAVPLAGQSCFRRHGLQRRAAARSLLAPRVGKAGRGWISATVGNSFEIAIFLAAVTWLAATLNRATDLVAVIHALGVALPRWFGLRTPHRRRTASGHLGGSGAIPVLLAASMAWHGLPTPPL